MPHANRLMMSIRPRTAAVLAAAASAALGLSVARAQQVSPPAILQMFEASYKTMERRAPDVFMAGYGGLWTPPPGRSDQSDFSVGYDVYDRFDLGNPDRPTLYGTETGLKSTVNEMHKVGVNVYTDLVWNHNGFSDHDNAGFVNAGGYPGILITHPDRFDGDFHGPFETGDFRGRIPGINLIDIDHSQQFQYIRNPVPGFNNNIPAGTTPAYGRLANVPDENNRRFYPDLQGPSTTVNGVTYHHWNSANPLAGDPVAENVTGYLMRHTRWMIEEIGVDGFRLDATKHMVNFEDGNPDWVLEYYDEATNAGTKTPLLDGSRKRVFGFGEFLDGNVAKVNASIKKDANANRDALDFALHYALKDNLTDNGLANNWYKIRYTTQDAGDGTSNDGTQGVAFDRSHDEGGAFLSNVANAYILTRPGNAVIYFNAKEFGQDRDFPRDGNGDALGGQYGDAITKLVNIRNTHGRGDFRELYIDQAFDPKPDHEKFSNVYAYERQKSMVVGLNSALGTATNFDSRTVFTSFQEGQRLVELTGNADNATVDPNNDIKSVLIVGAGGQVDLKIPRSENMAGNRHGKGYVVYGLPGPKGTLALTNVAKTIAGETPTPATNGTARLASIDVIKANSFQLQLNTQQVILNDGVTPGGWRDVHAEGDSALFRVDAGLNLNGNGGVDVTAPGDLSYGFEYFVTKSSPLYGNGGGDGQFRQTIDTSLLSEGYHYITARAYRHRDTATGGDGGPAIYTDFRKVIYVDRLRPVSSVAQLKQIGNSPEDRDVIIRSDDKTATGVHVFANYGASVTDAQFVQMALSGQNPAGQYDRDLFKYGLFDMKNGNHAFTVVTFETSYDPALGYAGGGVNVQRIAGVGFNTGLGAGLADNDSNGVYAQSDVNSFQNLLQLNNAQFNPAADLNADGSINEADNVLHVAWLTHKNAPANAIRSATNLRMTRANALDGTLHVPAGPLNVSGTTVPATPLTFTDTFAITGNKTITKTGGQALNVHGPQNHGVNAVLNVAEGTANIATDGGPNLTLNTTGAGAKTHFTATQHLKALGVSPGATATLAPSPGLGGGRTIVTKALNLTGGRLDLTNNNLVVDYTGPSKHADVTAKLAQGFGEDGTWSGPSGIVSSVAALGGGVVTGLAVAEAAEVLDFSLADTALWANQAVDATSVLVKYTYIGDANLDGVIDGGDYAYIDAYVNSPDVSYTHGDFNYDGFIDGGDYAYIDTNIGAQGDPIVGADGAGNPLVGAATLQAVPEPAGVAGLALAAGAALLRRRRHRTPRIALARMR